MFGVNKHVKSYLAFIYRQLITDKEAFYLHLVKINTKLIKNLKVIKFR